MRKRYPQLRASARILRPGGEDGDVRGSAVCVSLSLSLYLYLSLSLSLSLYICIYIYTHIDMYTIYIYIYIHKHTSMHACMHTYIHTYIHTHVYTMYIYIYTHSACVYIYIYICIQRKRERERERDIVILPAVCCFCWLLFDVCIYCLKVSVGFVFVFTCCLYVVFLHSCFRPRKNRAEECQSPGPRNLLI